MMERTIKLFAAIGPEGEPTLIEVVVSGGAFVVREYPQGGPYEGRCFVLCSAYSASHVSRSLFAMTGLVLEAAELEAA